ncbi:proton-coupled amino acid transporter-like protein pathetic isoform X2 [Leptinotarsa decemlineata]|uniref:proton-coupled amino acid transporter-like protein pathetic isoform X2 n=1 Tax=Leptinotarsa decemlineata TaxID=7539 RepID=UPI003D307659
MYGLDMKKEKIDSYTLSSVVDYNSRTSLANNDQIKAQANGSVDSITSITQKEYDPYEHRNVEHPNTYFGAVVHIIKGSLGTGILATPRAFKTAGLAVGGVGTILIGILCTYNIRLLVSASHIICVRTKTPSLDFAESVEAIFQNGPKPVRRWSRFARVFVEIALCLTYFLGIAVIAVFISESLTKLVSFFHPPAESWHNYFMLALYILLVFLCQIRELKHMVPFSFIANVTLVTAFVITLYYMAVKIQEVDISERHLATSIGNIPSYFSTVLFAMEGVGSIMPVENTMIESKFLGRMGVLNVAMGFVVTCHTFIGFCGYFAFGEDTHAAITQNLPSDKIPAQIAQACICSSMFFTFMLNHYVPTDILWRHLRTRLAPQKHNVAQTILRTLTVTFAMSVAAAAGHNLDSLIDLVGAVFFSILGLLVPGVVDILINWNDWGFCSWKLYKNILMILISLFALVSGSFYAIRSFAK